MYYLPNTVASAGSLAMRFVPQLGKQLGTLLTFFSIDQFVDFATDLATSTGRKWNQEGFDTQFSQFVGSQVGRVVPILEAAIRVYGSDKVMDMLEKLDTSGYSQEELSMIEGVKDALQIPIKAVVENTGDMDDDEVWGEDKDDFATNKSKSLIAMGYVKTLCAILGSTSDVRAFREALFAVEDEHLNMYDEMRATLF